MFTQPAILIDEESITGSFTIQLGFEKWSANHFHGVCSYAISRLSTVPLQWKNAPELPKCSDFPVSSCRFWGAVLHEAASSLSDLPRITSTEQVESPFRQSVTGNDGGRKRRKKAEERLILRTSLYSILLKTQTQWLLRSTFDDLFHQFLAWHVCWPSGIGARHQICSLGTVTLSSMYEASSNSSSSLAISSWQWQQRIYGTQ